VTTYVGHPRGDRSYHCDFWARIKLVEFYGATAFTYAVPRKLLTVRNYARTLKVSGSRCLKGLIPGARITIDYPLPLSPLFIHWLMAPIYLGVERRANNNLCFSFVDKYKLQIR
jgi:hypothetical protein